MHQVAQIWTYIFTNFPGVIPPDLKTGDGGRYKPISPRRARPPSHLFRASAAAAPNYKSKHANMQRDFTNRTGPLPRI